MQGIFTQGLMKKHRVFLSCGCQQDPAVFDLEQGRLSHMIPPPAKHNPQLKQALHKPALQGDPTAGTAKGH